MNLQELQFLKKERKEMRWFNKNGMKTVFGKMAVY